jgi:hypothetical protein
MGLCAAAMAFGSSPARTPCSVPFPPPTSSPLLSIVAEKRAMSEELERAARESDRATLERWNAERAAVEERTAARRERERLVRVALCAVALCAVALCGGPPSPLRPQCRARRAALLCTVYCRALCMPYRRRALRLALKSCSPSCSLTLCVVVSSWSCVRVRAGPPDSPPPLPLPWGGRSTSGWWP